MKTNLIAGILSTIALMFSKMGDIFFSRDTLMSKEAVDLLNDPTTREKFLEFTTGIDAEGKRKENSDSVKVEETFTKQNGQKVTLVKFT
jgi:hypothetical protein